MERVSRQFKFGKQHLSYRFGDWEDWHHTPETKGKNYYRRSMIIDNSPYTVTDQYTMLDLVLSVEDVLKNNIEGSFVETGVFMGGCCRLMMNALMYHEAQRPVYLYDTFEGVPEPDDTETHYDGRNLKEWYADRKATDDGSMWCYSNLTHVKENISSLGYKGPIHYIQGLVEDTIPAIAPDKISILRIDVDLVQPTRHVLDHLYDRLSPGGHLILDDYGFFPAVADTVDEFLGDKFIHRVNSTVRHIVK